MGDPEIREEDHLAILPTPTLAHSVLKGPFGLHLQAPFRGRRHGGTCRRRAELS